MQQYHRHAPDSLENTVKRLCHVASLELPPPATIIMCSAPFLRFSQQSSKPLPTLIIRCRFQFLQLLKKLDLILLANLFEKREVVLDIVFPKQILCKMPSAPAMMQRCIPRELFLYCTEYTLVPIRNDTNLPARAYNMYPYKTQESLPTVFVLLLNQGKC